MWIYNYTYNDLVKKMKKLWFEKIREAKWSHEIWQNILTKKIITIPKHWNKTISKWVIHEIIKTSWLSNLDFSKI